MVEQAVLDTTGKGDATVSQSGVALTRATTFRFALNVNHEQHQRLLAHAGASRLAFNHHLGRVKANLDQRAAERTYGIADAVLTPSLSWSKVAFINEMNERLEGRACPRHPGPRGRGRKPCARSGLV
jgi:putative transposase